MSGWQIPSIKGHQILIWFPFSYLLKWCVYHLRITVSGRPSFARVFFIININYLIIHSSANTHLQELHRMLLYRARYTFLINKKDKKQCIDFPFWRFWHCEGARVLETWIVKNVVVNSIALKTRILRVKKSLINFSFKNFLVTWFVYYKNQ